MTSPVNPVNPTTGRRTLRFDVLDLTDNTLAIAELLRSAGHIECTPLDDPQLPAELQIVATTTTTTSTPIVIAPHDVALGDIDADVPILCTPVGDALVVTALDSVGYTIAELLLSSVRPGHIALDPSRRAQFADALYNYQQARTALLLAMAPGDAADHPHADPRTINPFAGGHL